MKKRISLGTVVIAVLVLALMSAGIAAVSQWNVLDFLGNVEKGDHFIAVPIRKEAETENVRMSVESMVYDNGLLSFDWTVENKHPETPVYCLVEEFTVNGNACRTASLDSNPYCDFQERWLPGSVINGDEDPDDGIVQGRDIIRYTRYTERNETPQVYMRVKFYRPVRPVVMTEGTDDGKVDREAVEQQAAAGYYVIPCRGGSRPEPEGYLQYEPGEKGIAEGWAWYVSGNPPEDEMGGMTVETLEIRFDAAEQFSADPVLKETETKNARIQVSSAIYAGNELTFDLTVENKHPEIPVYCYIEEMTVNGKRCDAGVVYESGDGSAYEMIDCHEQWLPGWMYPDGIAKCGEFVRLPSDIAGEDTVHVTLKARICRPGRPFVLVPLDDGFGAEVEKAVAEGYYPIPSSDGTWADGFFTPEEDREICPEGWAIAAGGYPDNQDGVDGIDSEILEISFDTVKQDSGLNAVQLQAGEIPGNEYFTAVFEKAEVSEAGLTLALRVSPKDERCRETRVCWLEDGEGCRLSGIRYVPSKEEEYPSPDYEGEVVWQYRWSMVRPGDLPDTVNMAFRMQGGGTVKLPLKVR